MSITIISSLIQDATARIHFYIAMADPDLHNQRQTFPPPPWNQDVRLEIRRFSKIQMILFIISSLGALYFLMFLLIFWLFCILWCTTGANALSWSWKPIGSGFVPKPCPGDIPGGLVANPCVRLGQPLQEGFARSIRAPRSATRGSPTQNPTGGVLHRARALAAVPWPGCAAQGRLETPRYFCI